MSFEQFVERYKNKIHQFVAWDQRVGLRDAEDVAQEVFISVYTSAGRYQAKSSVKTWLYGLARNIISNWTRAQRRHQDGRLALDASPTLISTKPQPDVDAEVCGSLNQAFDFLITHNENLAQTLMLREWEGMSYQDIAQILGIPTGTVRSRLHAARKLLTENFSDEL